MSLIFPNEIILEINKYCHFYTQMNLKKTCREFNELIEDKTITKIPWRFHCQLTDDILKHYPNLTHLNAWNNKNITNESVRTLTSLTYLDAGSSYSEIESERYLYIYIKKYPPGMWRFEDQYAYEKKMRKCKSKITDKSVKFLTKLTYLNASGNPQISNRSVKLLTSLTTLHSYDNPNITIKI